MIRPLPGYVLIEPIEDEQKSAGGVYLPESSKDKPSKGRVISVSERVAPIGRINQEDFDKLSPVVIGQTVIYKKWTNQEVEDKGKKYLLVKFDELLGIVE